MSILTEEEILAIIKKIDGDEQYIQPALKQLSSEIQSALLAKLAVMEMPPVPNLTQEEREFLHYNPNNLVDFVQGHAAAYGRQAFAQGAASQLSAEPVGTVSAGTFVHWKDEAVPLMGASLYTLKEPK